MLHETVSEDFHHKSMHTYIRSVRMVYHPYRRAIKFGNDLPADLISGMADKRLIETCHTIYISRDERYIMRHHNDGHVIIMLLKPGKDIFFRSYVDICRGFIQYQDFRPAGESARYEDPL